ncbi:MAG: flagellar hook-basal body complex protein FliE [Clostridiales bacterium]|nr:flagellar hook-basal body complex protein FliE [Clostridiales bacterium]
MGAMSGLTEASRSGQTDRGTGSGTSFSDVLSEAMAGYRQAERGGDAATLDLLTGRTNDLSDTLIATEKAELALGLTIAVRNKAVDAYQEVMNMQV